MLDDIKSILKMFSGRVPVFFEVLCDSGEKVLLETENIYVDPSVEFINEIEKIVGKKHIQINVSESPLKNPIKRKNGKKIVIMGTKIKHLIELLLIFFT